MSVSCVWKWHGIPAAEPEQEKGIVRMSIRAQIAGVLLVVGMAVGTGVARAETVPYVIHISVDGLRGPAITELGSAALPNVYTLRREGTTEITRRDGQWVQGGGGLKIESAPSSVNYVAVDAPVVTGRTANVNTVVAWYRYTDIEQNGSDTRNFLWETAPSHFSLSFAVRSDTGDGRKHAQWFFQDASGGSQSSDAARGPIVDDGRWHHVALVWNRTNGHIKYYHDGKIAATDGDVAIAMDALHEGSTAFHIGNHRAGEGGRNWDGFIDEMAIYQTELTAAQIAGLAAGEKRPSEWPEHLVAYWPFDTDYASPIHNARYQGRAVSAQKTPTVHTDRGSYLESITRDSHLFKRA